MPINYKDDPRLQRLYSVTGVSGQQAASNDRQTPAQPAAAVPSENRKYLTAGEAGASKDMLPMRDWMLERMRAGVDWLPVQPQVTYSEQRDPTTGNYLSMNADAVWPEAMQGLGDRYEEALNSRYASDMATSNAVRDRVRAAAKPIEYNQPWTSQQLRWEQQTVPNSFVRDVYGNLVPEQRFVSFMDYTPVNEQVASSFFRPGAIYA